MDQDNTYDELDHSLPEEKRRFPRIDTHISVRLKGKQLSKVALDYLDEVIKNASLGGVFINMSKPFPKGTFVEIRLRLSDNKEINAKGLVVWTRRLGKQRGIGVQFTEIMGEGKRLIRDLIKD